MKIVFLGTNGWYSTETGSTVCTLIDSRNYYLVLDAGNGIYKLDTFITEKKPIYLFISHLHLDHISGIQILPKFSFPQLFTICIPIEMAKDFSTLMNCPFAVSADELAMETKVIGISKGESQLPFTVTARKLCHADLTYGYRFTIDGKTVTYACDTSVCENDRLLSQNADLLIHESSFPPGKSLGEWGHTEPLEAARLAKETGVKQLVLTHFAANIYTSLKQREEAGRQACKIFPQAQVAFDGLILEV